jgi:hypothetical protein
MLSRPSQVRSTTLHRSRLARVHLAFLVQTARAAMVIVASVALGPNTALQLRLAVIAPATVMPKQNVVSTLRRPIEHAL